MIRRPSCRLCQQLSIRSTPQSLFQSSRRPSSSAATAAALHPANGSTNTFLTPNTTIKSLELEQRDTAPPRRHDPTHPTIRKHQAYERRKEQGSIKEKETDAQSHNVQKQQPQIIKKYIRRVRRPSEEGQNLDAGESPAKIPSDEAVSLDDVTQMIVGHMREIRRRNMPVLQVWEECQQLVDRVAKLPTLTNEQRAFFRGTIQDVFRRLAMERCQSPQPHLPTLARYVLDQRIWDDALFLALLKRPVMDCVLALQGDKQIPSVGGVAALLDEIIEVWAIYLGSCEHHKRLSIGHRLAEDVEPDTQPQLVKALDDVRLATIRDINSYLQRYIAIFPTQLPHLATQLGALAALSYLCLCQLEKQGATPPKRAQSASFSSLMKQFLVGTESDFVHIYKSVFGPSNLDHDGFRKMNSIWKAIRGLVNKDSEPSAQALIAYREDRLGTHALQIDNWSRVRVEVQRWDANSVEQHWRRFLEDLDIGATEPWVETTAMAGFLWRFSELCEYDSVLMVFEEAKRRRCKLGISHYNPVLDCYKATNNLNGLQKTWEQMQREGVVPNNGAWSHVLECHMKHGYWKRALEQLEEMGDQWQETAKKIARLKGGYRGAPVKMYLPDISPVNTAIQGLLARGIAQPVAAVLKWAETHALKADRVTHNIILCHFIDRPNLGAATQRYVSDPSVFLDGADVYTLSILTKALFKSRLFDLARQPHTAQNAAVDTFLEDLRASGVTGPPHVFTTIIHTLLAGPTPNFNYAHKVLRFMDEEQGVAGTPHLLSLFAKYHLGQGSAYHVHAVRGLWRRWGERGWALDAFVYNQVLRGLASCRDVCGLRWDYICQMRAWAAENRVVTNYDSLVVLLGLMRREGRKKEAAALVRGLREGNEKAQETPGLEAKETFHDLVEQMRQDGFLENGRGQPGTAQLEGPVTHDEASASVAVGAV